MGRERETTLTNPLTRSNISPGRPTEEQTIAEQLRTEGSSTSESLPPRQRLAAPGKWPLVGEKEPAARGLPHELSILGLVRHSLAWTIAELQAMPQVERRVDIHCVTRWSRLGARFSGVLVASLLEECVPLPDARFVSFEAASPRGHSTSLPLAEIISLDVLLALFHEGQPLAVEHGGPARIITPRKYFYKSLKWVQRIVVLARDRLGYWERNAGYHNGADPWLEQRYIAPNWSVGEVRTLLNERKLSGQTVLGLQAGGLDLVGLDARGALLRNADFTGADLRNAQFAGANLSNARFERANLRGATFRGADVEGADFSAADLREADFRDASLFGATFFPFPAAPADLPCHLDATTYFSPHSAIMLTPDQWEKIRVACAVG